MQATQKQVVATGQCDTLKSDHCDRQCDKHCDTHPSKRGKIHDPRGLITWQTGISTVTRQKRSTVTPKPVTVVVTVVGKYDEGLLMSKQKIKAVWLTVERVAELKSCSIRTVWRYIQREHLLTYKEQVHIGSAKVNKTFVLPDPELLTLEMQDCNLKGREPGEFIERKVEVGERQINSALVYGYQAITPEEDGHEAV